MSRAAETARIVVSGFQNLDAFVLPAGNCIKAISVLKTGTTAGKIRLGTSVTPAVREVVSIIQTGDVTSNGDISVSLRGATAVLVPVLGTDNIAQTVTKMAAATYPGWTVAESLGTTVTWTANVAGASPGVTVINGPAGFAKTGPTADVLGANALPAVDVVASVALSGTDGNFSALTVVTPGWNTDKRISIGCLVAADEAIGVASGATGTLVVEVYKPF